MDVRGKLFTERVVRCWNKLARETVDAPSLEVFETQLDGAVDNLVQYKIWRLVALPMAEGLELDELPSNQTCSMIL